MAPEDQQFFDECRDLFVRPGWQRFINEIEQGYQSLHVSQCNSAEEFWKAKGRAEALAQVVGWQQAVLAAEEQAEQDDEGEHGSEDF